MNTKELRLGNHIYGVYDEDKKDVCEVIVISNQTEITEYEIWVESEKSNREFFESFEPITLTEKWLVRLHKEYSVEYKPQVIFIYSRFKLIWKPDYSYWYVVDNTSLTYLTKIEFVHEWQNFLYVMNGEELTLKK